VLLRTNGRRAWKPDCIMPRREATHERGRVPIAKITGQGLTAIAIVVAMLWACIIGQRTLRIRANSTEQQAFRELRILRNKARREPAAAPARPEIQPRHAKLG